LGEGLAGVALSDGRDVVTSAVDGGFRLPGHGPYVVLTRPTGYRSKRWFHPVETPEPGFVLQPETQPERFGFVHIGDVHLTAGSDEAHGELASHLELTEPEAFSRFLAELPQRHPEVAFVVTTGDLTNAGLAAEFRLLQRVVSASPLPVHLAPGNHDHMAGAVGATLSRNGYGINRADPRGYETHVGPRWYSFEYGGLHFCVVDWHTHELGLDDALQEQWLRADLAATPPERPWVLLSHDQMGRAFFEALPRPPVASFSGHWHTSRVVEVAGTLHCNTPTPFFAGLDYSPPAIRLVDCDAGRIEIRTEAQAPDAWRGSTFRAGRHAPALAPRWSYALAGAAHLAPPTAAAGLLLAGSKFEDAARGTLEALDLETGEPRWRAELPSAVKSRPLVHDDRVVVATVSGDLFAFGLEQGELRWHSPTDDPFWHWIWADPVSDGQHVFVGDQTEFRAVRLSDGSTAWRREDLSVHLNMCTRSRPAVVGDLVVAGFWPAPPPLHGVDRETGETRWRLELSEQGEHALSLLLSPSPIAPIAPDPDGRHVYVHSTVGLFKVDAERGAAVWQAQTPGLLSPGAPLVTPRGVVVTLAAQGLRLLDPADGCTRWVSDVDGVAPLAMLPYTNRRHPVLVEPALVGDLLLLAGLDGVLRVLDLGDGKPRTEHALGVPLAAPPVVAGGLVILTGVDGGLHALALAPLLA
jgi:outer membrane protein assembly factor BamB